MITTALQALCSPKGRLFFELTKLPEIAIFFGKILDPRESRLAVEDECSSRNYIYSDFSHKLIFLSWF